MEPFRASPFSLLANEASATFWAGRKATLKQLIRLTNGWKNRADSSLDVMWANLGAGKTHALLHVRHLLLRDSASYVVVFVDMPEDVGSFRDLFAKIMATVPLKSLAAISDKHQNQISMKLRRAFRAISHGSENEVRLASDWFVGGRPPLRELKATTGIDSRIETDSDAEEVLVELIRLAALAGMRFVLLIDEFQRVSHLPKKKSDALLSHVRSLFSRSSSNLHVVFAIASRMEKTVFLLLPEELQTILGMRPTISLPQMNKVEARDFIVERFRWFRSEGYEGPPEYPFSTSQLELIVGFLADEAKVPLIPRTLLQVLGIASDQFSGTNGIEADESELRELLSGLRWSDE